MEKKQDNKADYYFGSKPVLERAEDENEFEGSLTTSTELQNLAFIHEIPSAFWRSIWLDLVTQGTLTVTEPNFELGELDFVTNPMNNAFRKVLRDPIWKHNTESANYLGWNWTGDRWMSVFELMGYENHKDVVSLFISLYTINFGTRFKMQLDEMTQDPADQRHIRTWKDLFDQAANGFNHDIHTVVKYTDGPEHVFCFRFGYRNMSRLWIAKKGKICYVIWTGEN